MLNFRTRTFGFLIAALLFSTLACQTATSLLLPDTATPPPSPTVTPVPPPTATATITVSFTEDAFCPATLAEIMNAATVVNEAKDPEKERYLVTYKVTGDTINDPYYETVPRIFKDEQADTATHRQIWDYFTKLIPADQRELVVEYSVITDGKDNLLSAVVQTYDDPSLWALEVDIADSSDIYNLTFTLIHEFGHLLTLNADQVPPSTNVFNNPDDNGIYEQEVSLCPNFFPGEGCSEPDSYINAFHQRFWPGIYEEWSMIDQVEDEETYYQQLDGFYRKYREQFVSEYAASNPAEDIAESWSHFVLGPMPHGTSIAEQKILFFYGYPELVELRAQILNNLCAALPQ